MSVLSGIHPWQKRALGQLKEHAQPWDEEQGPRVVFADGTQSVYLADLSGRWPDGYCTDSQW